MTRDSSEEEDFELEQKYKVELDRGLNRVIVVDHIPVVQEEKVMKLVGVLRKIFSSMGGIHENGLYLPMEADPADPSKQVTKGYVVGSLSQENCDMDYMQEKQRRCELCYWIVFYTLFKPRYAFIEFENDQQAANAIKQANGYRLDKSHVFSVNRFTDIEKYSQMSEEYVPPKKDEGLDLEPLHWWLKDDRARDQFVIRFGEETAVFWNQKQDKPEKVYGRTHWTDGGLQWSPLGTYLVTFHRPGVALWGGATWKKMGRLSHSGVKLVDFSNSEKYVVSWSPENAGAPDTDEPHQLVVWDVLSGRLLRGFLSGKQASVWPQFRWSGDDSYVARLVENAIEVYEVPSCFCLHVFTYERHSSIKRRRSSRVCRDNLLDSKASNSSNSFE